MRQAANIVERLFGIKFRFEQPCWYLFKETITLERVKQVLTAHPDVLSWQNDNDPSCGNNDGVMYLVVKVPFEDDDEPGTEDVFFYFDPADKSTSFCIA